MAQASPRLVSIIVPVYNESAGLEAFHASLMRVLDEPIKVDYEVIYCDDGSTDASAQLISRWHESNKRIKLLKLSRNFGKESALSAGITAAKGDAILTLDADGQHPVELIPEFLKAWEEGAKVVVGTRLNSSGNDWFKRAGSELFYKLINKLTSQKVVPGSTDFRLIDRTVRKAFLTLHETERMTRGLIDWLGFERKLIYFTAHNREAGTPTYTRRKLLKLAANSFISLTPTPLYFFGYFGVLVTAGSLLLGGLVFVEQLLLGDPWHWRFTGTAMLGILILFLVGIVLMSQGILSLYISHIHAQSKQRPLYVVDYENSKGVSEQS